MFAWPAFLCRFSKNFSKCSLASAAVAPRCGGQSPCNALGGSLPAAGSSMSSIFLGSELPAASGLTSSTWRTMSRSCFRIFTLSSVSTKNSRTESSYLNVLQGIETCMLAYDKQQPVLEIAILGNEHVFVNAGPCQHTFEAQAVVADLRHQRPQLTQLNLGCNILRLTYVWKTNPKHTV